MSNKIASFAAIALLTISAGANAASMTASFDLRGYGSEASSLSYSSGDLDLTITPDTISNSGALRHESDIALTRHSNGIGVNNRNCAWWGLLCDSGQLDGFGSNDIALFHFSKDVTIESFTLLNSDWNDGLRIFGSSDSSFSQLGGRFAIPRSNVVDFAGLSDAVLTGDLFGIAAFGWHDNFRIAGLTVSYDAVPIPAALPLMLSGLAAFGLWGRRQKRIALAAS